MKTVVNTPIFHYPSHIFTGDNISYFFSAKYLWYHCNVKKKEFCNPIYNFKIDDQVKIDFVFYPEHPMHLYFKKPKWINKFIQCDNEKEANDLAKKYDYFINNYRYRGAKPLEYNWGHSKDLKNIELHLVAYKYKAVYEHDTYADDLELNEKYKEFLKDLHEKINPNKKPTIGIQLRDDDLWKRHLPNLKQKTEQLLFHLLNIYPDHLIVLFGEGWKYYCHPRVKNLDKYINKKQLIKNLGEHTMSLQYILSAFFCRELDIVFAGISGFTLFLESIRPRNLMPPIPFFWESKTFSGIDTCLEAQDNWVCPELVEYQKNNPEDESFHHYCEHFLYYTRDEEILKPFCMDYPNDLKKTFNVLNKLELKYRNSKQLEVNLSSILENCNHVIKLRDQLTFYQFLYNTLVNFAISFPSKSRNAIFRTLRGIKYFRRLIGKFYRVLRSIVNLIFLRRLLRGTFVYTIYKKIFKY